MAFRLSKDLKSLPADIIDTSPISLDYFNVSDFPEELIYGDNIISFVPNRNTLLHNSVIDIELIDASDNVVETIISPTLDFAGRNFITARITDAVTPGRGLLIFVARSRPTLANQSVQVIKWITPILISPNIRNLSDLLGRTSDAKHRLIISSILNNTISTPALLSSFTTGSIIFANGGTFSEDNANLYYNPVTKLVGIGTKLPTEKLHVSGSIRATSLSGGGTRMVVTDNNGILGAQSLPTTNGYRALFIATDSTTVTGNLVELTLIGSGIGTLTLTPAEQEIGTTIRIKGKGILSETGNSNIRLRVLIGGVEIGNSGFVPVLGNPEDDSFAFEYSITIRSIGINGTGFSQGRFLYESGASNADVIGIPSTGAFNIDTTVNNTIEITAEWDTASASLTSTNLLIELLNVS